MTRGSDVHEAIVIGGGPAGLSAGLVLGRCLRQTLICDDGRYRNMHSHALHCFLGQDGAHPMELLARSREQVQRYENVRFTAGTVTSITKNPGGFAVHLQDGELCTAKAVLVATGMVDERPTLKGIHNLFGRSVHVCPYCDGWEHREAPSPSMGRARRARHLPCFFGIDPQLVLCTNGQPLEAALDARLAAIGISVRTEAIDELEGNDGRLTAIRFRGGEILQRRALFFTTGQHPRSPLLQSLGCAHDDKGGLACDPDGRTNIAGAFVAGDVSRDVQLAIIAAAEGARAALAINKYLFEQEMVVRP